MSRRADASLTYLLAGGFVYLILWGYGLLVDHQSDANFIPLNTADDWLHLALGAGMVALGLLTTRRRAGRSSTAR